MTVVNTCKWKNIIATGKDDLKVSIEIELSFMGHQEVS
jgi:hypothetical protein